MIIKVWGHANGIEIIFTRKEGSIWTAELPSNWDGKYIVDLWAESDTGQRAYVCKVLFAIHGHKLEATILDNGYSGSLSLAGLLAQLEKGEFAAELKKKEPVAELKKGEFLTEAGKGGYAIENKVC